MSAIESQNRVPQVQSPPATPADQFIATFGELVTSEHGTTVSATDPQSVKLTYLDKNGYQGDQGKWDADMASVAFNQSVRGVNLVSESADGQRGTDGGFSVDDEFGGWLWDLPSVKDAEMHEFSDGKVGLLVTPEEGVDAKVLDELLVDSYGKYRVAVAGQ